jgi:ATP adenylyltransferase
VARGPHTFCLLNRFPYNNGHLLLAPYRHVGSFDRLKTNEWLDLFRLSARLMRRLSACLHPEGFNLGINLGKTAGAGIPGHLHLHIVPRWSGDTNFMPIVGHTKVLPQALDELYSLLTVESHAKGRGVSRLVKAG